MADRIADNRFAPAAASAPLLATLSRVLDGGLAVPTTQRALLPAVDLAAPGVTVHAAAPDEQAVADDWAAVHAAADAVDQACRGRARQGGDGAPPRGRAALRAQLERLDG